MKFDERVRPSTVHKFECVDRVSVKYSAVGSVVGVELECVQNGLRAKGTEVPSHCRILQVCFRVGIRGMDQIGEEHRVGYRVDSVRVSDKVKYPVCGVELDCEAAVTPYQIRGAQLPGTSGESDQNPSCLPDLMKEVGLGESGDIVQESEGSVSSKT